MAMVPSSVEQQRHKKTKHLLSSVHSLFTTTHALFPSRDYSGSFIILKISKENAETTAKNHAKGSMTLGMPSTRM